MQMKGSPKTGTGMHTSALRERGVMLVEWNLGLAVLLFVTRAPPMTQMPSIWKFHG